MSPVCSQPSTIVSFVASSFLWYPWKTLGPLTRISPSSAIFTSQPGKGLPIVPTLKSSGEEIVAAVEVSVIPQPSSTSTPAASKKRRISGLIGAAPETARRSLPPKRLRIFESTFSSAKAYWRAQQEAGLAAAAFDLAHLLADADRPVEDLLFEAALFFHAAVGGGVDLLEDPRHRGEVGRLQFGQVGEDLQRVALPVGDRGAEVEAAELDQQGEGVGERQVEVADVFALDDAGLVDHVQHRAVVAVADDAALRRAGGAGGVDEGADVGRGDRRVERLPAAPGRRRRLWRPGPPSRARRRWRRSSARSARAAAACRGPRGSSPAVRRPRRRRPWRRSSRGRSGTPRASWSGRSGPRWRRSRAPRSRSRSTPGGCCRGSRRGRL